MSAGPLLRPARDADSAGVIAIVRAAFAEYPGNVLDLDHEERGLLTPGSSYEAFWVLEAADGGILGCIGAATRVPGLRAELKKCYVRKDCRGQGLGKRLVRQVEDWTRAHGMHEVELWSDTRFVEGHRAYAGLGYRRTGAVRELHDLSHSTEWHFLRSGLD